MQFRPVLLPIAAAALLASCGSSTSANKSNFTKAIDATFAKNCIEFDPTTVESDPTKVLLGTAETRYPLGVENSDTKLIQVANEFVKVGLLTSTSGTVNDQIWGNVRGNTYSLTAAGEKALETKDGTAFCAGHWHVKEITNFTVPGKAENGSTTSTVDFTYVADDVPAWAAALPGAKQEFSKTWKTSAKLVLTNNGWEADVGSVTAFW